jgi:hypothetical protein
MVNFMEKATDGVKLVGVYMIGMFSFAAVIKCSICGYNVLAGRYGWTTIDGVDVMSFAKDASMTAVKVIGSK